MATVNSLAPTNRNKLRDANGGYYYAPAQPTFDVMQQVAIPNYVIKPSGYSYTNMDSPNVAYISNKTVAGENKSPTALEFTKSHEMQHQIGGEAYRKGQLEKNDAVYNAWGTTAESMGLDKHRATEVLKAKLSQPEVQAYFKSLGAENNSRILNPKVSPIDEILADLSAWQTVNKQDMLTNPVLAKYVFNDPQLNELVKSTTGMSGVVIGDSDYAPYSREAARAWGYQPPQTTMDKLKGFFSK